MTNSSANLTSVTSSASLNGVMKKSGSLSNCPSLSGEMENVINRKTSSTSLYEQSNAFSQDSILPNMNRFINSINHMNHVVMIPSKLYDFEGDEPVDSGCDTKSVHSLSSDEGGSSLSHSSSISSNLVTFEVAPSDTANNTSAISSDTNGSTLYDNYRMLIQAKEELLWGTSANSEEQVDTHQSVQFRHNLNQLNMLLTQFADMADFLTSKYQTMYEN